MWYIGLFFLVRTMAFFLSFFVLFCFSGLTTLPVPPSFFLSFFISISWSLANLFLFFLSLSSLSHPLSPSSIYYIDKTRQTRQTDSTSHQSIHLFSSSLPPFLSIFKFLYNFFFLFPFFLCACSSTYFPSLLTYFYFYFYFPSSNRTRIRGDQSLFFYTHGFFLHNPCYFIYIGIRINDNSDGNQFLRSAALRDPSRATLNAYAYA